MLSLYRIVSPLAAAAALALPMASAHAGYNSPISFEQGGKLLLTLDFSVGGLDHIIQQTSSSGGIVDAPLMATTDTFNPSAQVFGFTPSDLGDTLELLLDYQAGTEVVLRLSNVESDRLGTPGTLAGDVFTGSDNGSGGKYFTFVETLSPTSVRVTFEDLFPVDPTDPNITDINAEFFGGADVVVTLSVVPEPQTYALMLVGLAMLGAVVVRRERQKSGLSV